MKATSISKFGWWGVLSVCLGLGVPAGAEAEPVLRLPHAVTECPVDMVRAGSVCVDRYEASVWSNVDGTGTQYGAGTSADYPCARDGSDCGNIFAASRAGVKPSAHITWFQAQQACVNVGKRLVTNTEWQAAAAGTPDSTLCNTSSQRFLPTGSFEDCESQSGAYDMIGNVDEWVAKWVPPTTACFGSWGALSDDTQCLVGAGTSGNPHVLSRGGSSWFGQRAGALAVRSLNPFFDGEGEVGFRCAR